MLSDAVQSFKSASVSEIRQERRAIVDVNDQAGVADGAKRIVITCGELAKPCETPASPQASKTCKLGSLGAPCQEGPSAKHSPTLLGFTLHERNQAGCNASASCQESSQAVCLLRWLPGRGKQTL